MPLSSELPSILLYNIHHSGNSLADPKLDKTHQHLSSYYFFGMVGSRSALEIKITTSRLPLEGDCLLCHFTVDQHYSFLLLSIQFLHSMPLGKQIVRFVQLENKIGRLECLHQRSTIDWAADNTPIVNFSSPSPLHTTLNPQHRHHMNILCFAQFDRTS